MPQPSATLVLFLFVALSGLTVDAGPARGGRGGRAPAPPVRGDATDPPESSVEEQVLMTAGFVCALVLCVWFSNRIHDNQEADKQRQRQLPKEKPLPPVFVPKITPARPRHPTARLPVE